MDRIESALKTELQSINYHSHSYTKIHKISFIEAISAVYNQSPQIIVAFLSERSYNIQNLIFKKYLEMLNNKLPFSYLKKNKLITIKSLADQELSIFQGISTFTAKVDNYKQIKNQTQELYIGGRKSTYIKPYFIGKILSIQNSLNMCLLGDIQDYNFSKIKLKTTQPGTEVQVSHLRVYPHYQMGALAYLNKIKNNLKSHLKVD